MDRYAQSKLYEKPQPLIVWAVHRFNYPLEVDMIKVLLHHGVDLTPACEPDVIRMLLPGMIIFLLEHGAEISWESVSDYKIARDVIQKYLKTMKPLKDLSRRVINKIIRTKCKSAEPFFHLPLEPELIRYLLYDDYV